MNFFLASDRPTDCQRSTWSAWRRPSCWRLAAANSSFPWTRSFRPTCSPPASPPPSKPPSAGSSYRNNRTWTTPSPWSKLKSSFNIQSRLSNNVFFFQIFKKFIFKRYTESQVSYQIAARLWENWTGFLLLLLTLLHGTFCQEVCGFCFILLSNITL